MRAAQPDRPGYTRYTISNGRRRYHGVIWSRANAVIWTCDHEHVALNAYEGGATRCAMDQMALLQKEPPHA